MPIGNDNMKFVPAVERKSDAFDDSRSYVDTDQNTPMLNPEHTRTEPYQYEKRPELIRGRTPANFEVLGFPYNNDDYSATKHKYEPVGFDINAYRAERPYDAVYASEVLDEPDNMQPWLPGMKEEFQKLHDNNSLTRSVYGHKISSSIVVSLKDTSETYEALKGLVGGDESRINISVITNYGLRDAGGVDPTKMHDNIKSAVERAFKTGDWSGLNDQLAKIHNMDPKKTKSDKGVSLVAIDENGTKYFAPGSSIFGKNIIGMYNDTAVDTNNKDIAKDENGNIDQKGTLNNLARNTAKEYGGDLWNDIEKSIDRFKQVFDNLNLKTMDKNMYIYRIKQELLTFLNTVMYMPSLLTGKKSTAGGVESIKTDINTLSIPGIAPEIVIKIANKYRAKMEDIRSQREANTATRKKNAASFMSQVDELKEYASKNNDDRANKIKSKLPDIERWITINGKVGKKGISFAGTPSIEFTDDGEPYIVDSHVQKNVTLDSPINSVSDLLRFEKRVDQQRANNKRLNKTISAAQLGRAIASTTGGDKASDISPIPGSSRTDDISAKNKNKEHKRKVEAKNAERLKKLEEYAKKIAKQNTDNDGKKLVRVVRHKKEK